MTRKSLLLILFTLICSAAVAISPTDYNNAIYIGRMSLVSHVPKDESLVIHCNYYKSLKVKINFSDGESKTYADICKHAGDEK